MSFLSFHYKLRTAFHQSVRVRRNSAGGNSSWGRYRDGRLSKNAKSSGPCALFGDNSVFRVGEDRLELGWASEPASRGHKARNSSMITVDPTAVRAERILKIRNEDEAV